MCDSAKDNTTKAVGGQIPIELYWEFKQAQVDRHESATQALENAIRVYIDIAKEENN